MLTSTLTVVKKAMVKQTIARESVLKKSIVLSTLVSLCACSLQAHEQKSALLPADSKQARAEIIEIVSQSLGGKNIAIAESVFQDSSRLLLGKGAVTSPGGVKIIRSNKAPALVFELVKQGDNCLLRRIEPEQEWQLTTTRCFIRVD